LVRLFPLLESAVGIFGLAGLDRLLGLRIVTIVQNIITLTDRNIFQVQHWTKHGFKLFSDILQRAI